MIINGLQKLTLLDFPEKVACTVFTSGCNCRCPFCHNALLVSGESGESYTEQEIFSFFDKRKGVLDGVAITGGEPLLQRDIESFLYEIKSRGYAVKLDTNGCYPEKLEGILKLGLADYVAMDIKNRLSRYGETVGLENFDVEPIKKSVGILMTSGVEYEFRTTVVSQFHTVEDIETLASEIAGAKRYFLQSFVDSGNLIDESCTGVDKATMEKMLEAAKRYVPNAKLRGI